MTQTIVDTISAQQIAEFEDATIGYLVWYGVPGDCNVTLAEWLRDVADTEVSDMIPKATRPVDAFKQAVSRAKGVRKFEYAAHGGQTYTYKFLPRDVGFDEDSYLKAIVVEELDSQRHSLSHETVVDLIYDRENEIILTPDYKPALQDLPDEIQESVRERVGLIQEEYHAAIRCLNPAKIRNVIQEELKWRQGSILVRESGGVYFTPSRSRLRLQALDGFVNDSLPGPSMHMMPILDTDRQRAMIREAFENEVTNATESLMTELTSVLKGEAGTLTHKRAVGYMAQYQRMHSQMEEYTGILDTTLGYAETRLSLLHKQVLELFSHIGD